jgi:microcystin-dependent protein
MPFYNWSTTAANNATSDPTCPFPEGMAPSAVNDGVRGAMARLREFGNDISGSIVTTGSSTAYAVSSNQGFTGLAGLAGQMIAFTPHTTCGATVTLNVDGLGAQPLRSAPSVELLAGTLIQGTPYIAVYNQAAGVFYLSSFFGNPYNVPIGGMMPFLSTTAPNSSFVLPYGQAISRTTYAKLFSMIGGAFGAGDGSTTFNVPDLRGRVPVGLDNMGGAAAGRVTPGGSGVTGTTIGATGGGETVTLSQANLPNVNFGGSISGSANGSLIFGMLSDGGHLYQVSGTVDGVQVIGSGAHSQALNLSVSGSATVNSGGSNVPANNLPPAIVVPWILRVI